MYAVIETGGKQYRVAPENLIQVEKLNAEVGETVNFPVLLFKPADAQVETNPSALNHISVKATVVNQIRGDKIKIIKFRRRKHHRKQMGHRQYYTLLKINDIGG
jgi:large subunit ribosomal protein L21